MKQSKQNQIHLTEQEKLDKEFRRQLYLLDGLSSEHYALADIIKDYIDQKIELVLRDREMFPGE